jgi:hypothetical protein
MMKRLLLAFTIVATGVILFSALRNSAVRSSTGLSLSRGALVAEREMLVQAQKRHAELTARVHELKHEVGIQPHAEMEMRLANLIATNGTAHLTPEMRERLLAELGFNWNSTADFVVINKDSLPKLSMGAVRGNRLTDTVCGVLAIKPEERAGIESVMAGLTDELKTWVPSHAQRTEPQGDVVAEYTLPLDEEFSQSRSNAFAAAVIGELGTERGRLMLDYAASWMFDSQMRGAGSTTLTVRRPADGPERLSFQVNTPNGGYNGALVNPFQQFPEVFRNIFPGGWTDVAQREGFELPKDFKK